MTLASVQGTHGSSPNISDGHQGRHVATTLSSTIDIPSAAQLRRRHLAMRSAGCHRAHYLTNANNNGNNNHNNSDATTFPHAYMLVH
jgi:hypothetical protein